MAKRLMFSVYDVKPEIYFPPFACRTVGEALRSFEQLLGDPQTILSKSPGDYRLFAVGEFDEETGVVTPVLGGVRLVEEGLSLVKEA